MSLAASPDSSLGHGQAGPAIKVPQRWGPGVRLDAWERCCVSGRIWRGQWGRCVCAIGIWAGCSEGWIRLVWLCSRAASERLLSKETDPCCLTWAVFVVTGCPCCPLTQPRVWDLGGPGHCPTAGSPRLRQLPAERETQRPGWLRATRFTSTRIDGHGAGGHGGIPQHPHALLRVGTRCAGVPYVFAFWWKSKGSFPAAASQALKRRSPFAGWGTRWRSVGSPRQTARLKGFGWNDPEKPFPEDLQWEPRFPEGKNFFFGLIWQ